MEIRIDDLSGREIAALLQIHLDHAAAISPPEACHALDFDALKAPEVTFWTAWEDHILLGCGALKDLGGGLGEVKSMHTAEAARDKGVASAILKVILGTARARGLVRISLETGSSEDFAPARNLYRNHGFEECPPFADYAEHDFSMFMTMNLKQREDS